jgi:small-conductance mechanosensitive channel
VLSTLRTILEAEVWGTALAVVLSVLGLDVTAIAAGVGIGGLVISLAARSSHDEPPSFLREFVAR